jgi:RHS repeat-associated protein
MAVVNYTVLNGEVIAEKRGGVRSCYVPDPLGSTRALLDNTQSQTDTFDYWPYGEVKPGRTGTTATPFQYVGKWGYYQDSSSRTYVRARVLRPDLTRWLTEDPIGASDPTSPYNYVGCLPSSFIDASGLQAGSIAIGGGGAAVGGSLCIPGFGEVCLAIGAGYCIYKAGEWVCDRLSAGPACPPTSRKSPEPGPARTAPEPSPPQCPPCLPPPPPPVKHCPTDRSFTPHYFQKLKCCCFGCHTHVFVYHQAPYPNCTFRLRKEDGQCLSDCRPGPCPK